MPKSVGSASLIEELAQAVAARFRGVCPAEDYEAVVQAAREGVWRAQQSYEAERALYARVDFRRAYLARGARMAAAAELARVRIHRGRLAEGDADGEPVDVTDESPTVEELVLWGADRRKLGAAIEQLDPVPNVVVRLRLEGKSYRAVGELLGVSHEWVRQIEDRAIETLRQLCVDGMH